MFTEHQEDVWVVDEGKKHIPVILIETPGLGAVDITADMVISEV